MKKRLFMILIIAILCVGVGLLYSIKAIDKELPKKETIDSSKIEKKEKNCYSCLISQTSSKDRPYKLENHYDFCIKEEELTVLSNYQEYTFDSLEDYNSFPITNNGMFYVEEDISSLYKKLYVGMEYPYEKNGLEKYLDSLKEIGYQCMENEEKTNEK